MTVSIGNDPENFTPQGFAPELPAGFAPDLSRDLPITLGAGRRDDSLRPHNHDLAPLKRAAEPTETSDVTDPRHRTIRPAVPASIPGNDADRGAGHPPVAPHAVSGWRDACRTVTVATGSLTGHLVPRSEVAEVPEDLLEGLRALPAPVRPPVVVHGPTGLVMDGWASLALAQENGSATLDVLVYDGPEHDAVALVMAEDARMARRRTTSERLAAAMAYLTRHPETPTSRLSATFRLHRSVIDAERQVRFATTRVRASDGRLLPSRYGAALPRALELASADPSLSARRLATEAGVSWRTAQAALTEVRSGRATGGVAPADATTSPVNARTTSQTDTGSASSTYARPASPASARPTSPVPTHRTDEQLLQDLHDLAAEMARRIDDARRAGRELALALDPVAVDSAAAHLRRVAIGLRVRATVRAVA